MSKPGERDDTLPPEYRFTEEDRKVTFPSPSCFCTSGIYLQIITIKDDTFSTYSSVFTTAIYSSKAKRRQTKAGTFLI